MAQKKAGEVDAFLSRPDGSFPVVLVYGPDSGLVAERAERVVELSGIDRSDPFAAIILQADEVERDVGRLFDEASTISMFGGKRLVRVKGAGNGRNLADAVRDLAAKPPEGALVLIEAGDLKKNSALRVNAERGRAAMALPCYPDEGRALDRMIDEELAAHQLAMDRPARERLKSRLGADRMASRGEVQKLCLYALGQPGITEEDVDKLVGDVSAETVDDAVDAAAAGEVRKLPDLLSRLTSAGASSFQLHSALARHFQQLLSMRQEIEAGGATVASAVEKRRPHFRRRAALEVALRSWSRAAITQILSRIEADVLLGRKEAALSETIVQRTLMEIGVEAARRKLARQ